MDEGHYENKIRHSHYNAFSGGGIHAGHEGSVSVSSIRGVEMEIMPIDTFEPKREKIIMPTSKIDPYARKCDFGNNLKFVN